MFKMLKVFCLPLILIILVMAAGCSGSSNTTGATDANDPNGNLDTGTQEISDTSLMNSAETISFGFFGYNNNTEPKCVKYVNEMLEELNRRTMRELNTKVEFVWYHYHLPTLKEVLRSVDAPDAVQVNGRFLTALASDGMLMDMTDLLPVLCPRHYSNLMDYWNYESDFLCKYDGKIFGIPNNDLVSPRYCVVARDDMVEKYMPAGIRDLDDYYAFLVAVKEHENDVYPGCVSPYYYTAPAASYYIDAYLTGNGYYHLPDKGMFVLGRWNDDGINPVFIHEAQEMNWACDQYKDLISNELFHTFGFSELPKFAEAVRSGKIVSMLHYMPIMHQIEEGYINLFRDQNFKIYPLYMDKTYLRDRNRPYWFNDARTALGVNTHSANADRVLMFIDWIHSSQENYDLLMYGLLGKNYNLSGNKLDLATIPYNNSIAGWWGSELFRDHLLDRSYFYEPDDCLGFIEDCALENTMSADVLYSGKGYDFAGYCSRFSEADGHTEYRVMTDSVGDQMNQYMIEYFKYCTTLDNGFTENRTFAEIVKAQGLKADVDEVRSLVESELEGMKK